MVIVFPFPQNNNKDLNAANPKALATSIGFIVQETGASLWHLQEGPAVQVVLGDKVNLLARLGSWVWHHLPLPSVSSNSEQSTRCLEIWSCQVSGSGAASASNSLNSGWGAQVVLCHSGQSPVLSCWLSSELVVQPQVDKVVGAIIVCSRGNVVTGAWRVQWSQLIDSAVSAHQWCWRWWGGWW